MKAPGNVTGFPNCANSHTAPVLNKRCCQSRLGRSEGGHLLPVCRRLQSHNHHLYSTLGFLLGGSGLLLVSFLMLFFTSESAFRCLCFAKVVNLTAGTGQKKENYHTSDKIYAENVHIGIQNNKR